MMELKTIAELIGHAAAYPPGAVPMLKAARTLLDVAIAAHGDVIQQLPAPAADVREPNGGGRVKRKYTRRVKAKGRKAKKASAKAKPATRRKRASIEQPTPTEAPRHVVAAAAASGVTINGSEISFNGKSITVTPKEAIVAAALAAVTPQLLGHDMLARKFWPEADKNTGMVCAAQCTKSLADSLDAIGLKVTRVRGMGASLSEA